MDLGQQEFKIYTYCTDFNNQIFKQLTKDLSIEILPELLPWTNDFYAKSFSVYETLKKIDGETIVLVCDSYDVLPINGATNQKLLESIKNNFDLNKITFNSEKNCYPNESLRELHPDVNSIWKYLNGGIYVGKSKNILSMLDSLLPTMPGVIDQEIFSMAYINGNFNIELDHQCKVFQTLYELKENDLNINGDEVINNITNTKPLLVHGNGGSDMSKFLKSNNQDVDVNKIFDYYLNEFYNDELLVRHRSYVEQNSLGFGERAFHPMWRELIKLQPENFKFLEIGVYKGQVLSLVKLLSDTYNKKINYYGVTPLNNSGDKFSHYDNVDYKQIITSLFTEFNLEFNPDNNLILGDSTDEKIKSRIKDLGLFDLIYIDGCHDYDCVISDIMLIKEISKNGSYIVLDDASCFKNLSSEKFKGHIDVCQAVKDVLESDPSFVEIICVGHNRVFKKII